MQTRLERRAGVAKSLNTLRAYRKDHRLCRECGEPLAEKDKARCFNCKTEHATRTSVLYYKRKYETA